MIPKTIHYCWLSNDPIPQKLQDCMSTWKAKLPDYEFVLWNFDRFDIDSSLWVRQAFENKKYAFAADYIRLFAVFNSGGFYLDMDIEVLRSFDDLLNNEIVLAYENDNGNIEAGCFGAEKGNLLIKNCLDYYTDRHFVKPDGSFDILTLPVIMSRFISSNNASLNDKYFFTCKSFETGVVSTKDYSYTIHHFAGSWLPEEERIIMDYFRRMQQKYPRFIAVFLAIVYGFFVRITKAGIKKSFIHYKKQITGK